MQCPNCNGDMWDNTRNKRNPKAPDFKCKDPDCLDEKGMQTAVWLPKGQQKPAPRQAQRPTGRPVVDIKKEMLISYEKDLMVSAVSLVVAEMASGINPANTATRALTIFHTLRDELRHFTINKYFAGTFPPPVEVEPSMDDMPLQEQQYDELGNPIPF